MSKISKKPAEENVQLTKNEVLLPSVFRTDINKKMLDSTLNLMTSKGKMLPFYTSYGTQNASNVPNKFLDNEPDQVRRESQTNLAVTYSNAQGDYQGKMSYLDIENYFNVKGMPLKDGVDLDDEVRSLQLPLLPYRLTDYHLYYWIPNGLPSIRIHYEEHTPGELRLHLTRDIVGKPFASLEDDATGKTWALANGQRVFFTGAVESTYLTTDPFDPVVYIALGVGNSIYFIKESMFDKRVPDLSSEKVLWDEDSGVPPYQKKEWDANKWDSTRYINQTPEYHVIDRGDSDNTPWSIINCWYHINRIREVCDFYNLRIEDYALEANKAKRPIIQLNRDIKLYNWPSSRLGDVATVIRGQPSRSEGKASVVDQYGYRVAEGDVVAFTESPILHTATVVDNKMHFIETATVAIEGSGVVIVGSAAIRYYNFIYKNNKWQPAQNKTSLNQCPLVDMFDEQGISIGDSTVYFNTEFFGAKVLDYANGASYDSVLQRHIKLSNIEFDFLSSTDSINLTGPNQIQFYTDIDRKYSYDVGIDEQLQSGINLYKIGRTTFPFWKIPTGLSTTVPEQVIEYTVDQESVFTEYVASIVDGFDTIHVFENISGEPVFYFKLKDYGIVRYTSVGANSLFEIVLPVITNTRLSDFKIVCHDLSSPLELYVADISAGYTKPVLLTEPVVFNNGATNGTMTVTIEPTYVVDGVVYVNPIAEDNTKFYWKFNNKFRVGLTRPQEKFRFISSSSLRDRSLPLFSDYDYRVSSVIDTSASSDLIKIEADSGLIKKANPGDKILFENVSLLVNKKTAPSAITCNPANQAISTVNYYSIYQHAVVEQSSASTPRSATTDPTFGSVLTTQLSSGSIFKHNYPVSLFGLVAINSELDLMDIIKKQGKQYDSFMARFRTELDHVVNRSNKAVTSEHYPNITSSALNLIFVNQTEETFWHHSNMIGWGSTYNEQQLTVAGDYSFESPLEPISFTAGKETILHAYYQGRQLVRGVDYGYIGSVNGAYTGLRFSSYYQGRDVVLRQWPVLFSSRVPASFAKLGLSPVYCPEIYKDETYIIDTYFMIRHDGTRQYLPEGVVEIHNGNIVPANIIDALLYEYEKLVFSSIAKTVEDNQLFNMNNRTPGYFRETKQSYTDVSTFKNEELIAWQLENNMFVFDSSTYDTSNKFTYRYEMADVGISGSWRAIYKYFYDTDRPHTHPWEIVGYTVKPQWWDSNYSWTDPVKRSNLVNALSLGKRNTATGKGFNPYMARFDDGADVFPVDAEGKLIAPLDFPWIAQFVTNTDFSGAWACGELGPQEQVFASTHKGVANDVTAMYLLNPLRFVNDLWRIGYYSTNSFGIKLDPNNGMGWRTGAIDANYHGSTSTCFTSGLEALMAEHYLLHNKDFYNDIVVKSNNTGIVKEFLLGGFTNKNSVRIQSTSINSQRQALYIPEENFSVRTIKHYTSNEIFFSALRVIWTGAAWMIYGFTNENPYFTAYTPSSKSSVMGYDLNGFSVKEKEKYSTETATYPYGYSFTDKQELFDVIKGIGLRLEDQGFIFDAVESGDVKNWQLSAKQFITWSSSPLLPGSYIDLNPAADEIKINLQETAQIDNLAGTDQNSGLCVGRNGKPLFTKDLVVFRGEVTSLKTKDTSNPIYGVKLSTSVNESVIHLEPTSVFNDVYFAPEQRLSKRSFLVTGKKTTGWTGKLYAPGYFFYNNELQVNLDNLVDQGRNLLDIESSILDPVLVEAARAQFGLDKNPELRQLFLTDESEVLFKNSITFNKGTRQIFASLEPLTHPNNSFTSPYEEYLVRTSEMGNTRGIEFYEFQLPQSAITQHRQIIDFSLDNPIADQRVHNVNKKSWVYSHNLNEPIKFTTTRSQSKLAIAGPIVTGDTNYSVESVADIESMYQEFKPLWSIPRFDPMASYAAGDLVRMVTPETSNEFIGGVFVFNSTRGPAPFVFQTEYVSRVEEKYLPNFFINTYDVPNKGASNMFTAATWQVMQTMDDNQIIMECCPGPADVSKTLIETITPHNLTTGDKVLIVNTEQEWGSANGIWTVEVITDTEFYIPSRLTQKIIGGKIFTFKPVRFRTYADFAATLAGNNGYDWKNKVATTSSSLGKEVLTSELTPSGYSKIAPLAIVDRYAEDTEVNTSWDTGAFAVYQIQFANGVLVAPKIVKEELLPVTSANIEHVIVYDHVKKQTTAKIEIFDPKNLKLPKVFLDEIDSLTRVDPARYNRTSSDYKAAYAGTAWFDEKLGFRWWNTSAVKFTDYDIGSVYERAFKFGKMTDGSSVDVYEWTKSPVHPSQWADVVKSKTVVLGQVASGSVYIESINNEDAYSWCEQEDYVNGQVVKVYYFWVKNKTTIQQSTRSLTTLQLSKTLLNPSAAGIPWCAPLTANAMLVVGLEDVLSENAVVQIKKKSSSGEKHQDWIFIADANPTQTIPEYLHIRLRDSLGGTIITEKFYEEPYNRILYTERRVPDVNLHPLNKLGNQIRPYAQAWFDDVYQARRTLLREANTFLKNIDVVNGIANWNAHLNSGVKIGEEDFDMTPYFGYVDYQSTDYDSTKSPAASVYSEQEALNLLPSILADSYIAIVNDLEEAQLIYQVISDGFTKGITPVWRKNGTIAFKEFTRAEYDLRTWDGSPWDYYEWDDSWSLIFFCILEALRRDLFVLDYKVNYNKLMCVMFRQVLSDQFYVDWLAKASTIQPYNLIGADLTTEVELKRDSAATLIGYFKNVKSFRDKLRNSVIKKTLEERVSLSMSDSTLQFNITHEFANGETAEFKTVYYDNQVKHLMLTNSALAFTLQDIHPTTTVIEIDDGTGKVIDFGTLLHVSVNDQIIEPPDRVYPEGTQFRLPNAAADSPIAIWIDNERIEYTRNTGTGVSGLTRGTLGTPIAYHAVGARIYIENDTLLPVDADWKNSPLPGPYFNDLGKSLEDSTNDVATIVKSKLGT